MSQSIAQQVMALQEMDIRELQEKYRSLYGIAEPSEKRGKKAAAQDIPCNRRQLVAKLAYRIQELAFGGLSLQAREKLRDIADETERREQSKGPEFLPGTRFVREFRNKTYEVVATEDGFTWDGKPFPSLTAAAKAISGTHQSGLRFFGVKSGRGKK
jgi:hypothetical protein